MPREYCSDCHNFKGEGCKCGQTRSRDIPVSSSESTWEKDVQKMNDQFPMPADEE